MKTNTMASWPALAGCGPSVVQAVTAGSNPITLKKGIDKTCDYLVKKLKEVARPVKGTEDIRVRPSNASLYSCKGAALHVFCLSNHCMHRPACLLSVILLHARPCICFVCHITACTALHVFCLSYYCMRRPACLLFVILPHAPPCMCLVCQFAACSVVSKTPMNFAL